MGIVGTVSFLLVLYTLMVLLHEFGHYIMLKFYGVKDIKYELFKGKDLFVISYPSTLSKNKDKAILIVGLVLGGAPLFLIPGLHPFFMLCLASLYLLMCKHDIKRYNELSE